MSVARGRSSHVVLSRLVVQTQHHTVLVVEAISDAYGTRFETVPLESDRSIQPFRPWILSVYGEMELQQLHFASVCNGRVEQFAGNTAAAPGRVNEDPPKHGSMSDLSQRLAP